MKMPSLYYENLHGRKTGLIIAGLDEVGRGPLAGPVVAAAVILPERLPAGFQAHIDDSKALTAPQREELLPLIHDHCRCAIAEASVAEIDSINILQASLLAMRRAAAMLGAFDRALVDGNQDPRIEKLQSITIVGGDAKSLSIAAASIIAKVARDRMMAELAETFPHYGWQKNAGYGTPAHLEALRTFGPTPHHRQSFAPVMNCRAA